LEKGAAAQGAPCQLAADNVIEYFRVLAEELEVERRRVHAGDVLLVEVDEIANLVVRFAIDVVVRTGDAIQREQPPMYVALGKDLGQVSPDGPLELTQLIHVVRPADAERVGLLGRSAG